MWIGGSFFIANCPKLDTLDKKFHCSTEKPKNCTYISTKKDETSENIADKTMNRIYMRL